MRRNDEQRKGARSRREINERDERKDMGYKKEQGPIKSKKTSRA